jgi:hypothetical protein
MIGPRDVDTPALRRSAHAFAIYVEGYLADYFDDDVHEDATLFLDTLQAWLIAREDPRWDGHQIHEVCACAADFALWMTDATVQ